jgi:beta-galactosidase
MKTARFSLFFLFLVCPFFFLLGAVNHPRLQKMDADWKFHLGDVPGGEQPSLSDKDWRTLDLPHDWSIEAPFDKNCPAGGNNGFLPGGIGWYRKTLYIPQWKDHYVALYFEGVYMNAEGFVNGTHWDTSLRLTRLFLPHRSC